MYVIVNVIYGVPLHTHERGFVRSEALETAIENELDGFVSYYRGGGDEVPAAFGIVLGEFDECVHHTELNDIPQVASHTIISKYHTMFHKLPDELKDELQKFGKPRVFFLWSSS